MGEESHKDGEAPGFVSEPAEVQQALQTGSQARKPFKKTLTWTPAGVLMMWLPGAQCGNKESM